MSQRSIKKEMDPISSMDEQWAKVSDEARCGEKRAAEEQETVAPAAAPAVAAAQSLREKLNAFTSTDMTLRPSAVQSNQKWAALAISRPWHCDSMRFEQRFTLLRSLEGDSPATVTCSNGAILKWSLGQGPPITEGKGKRQRMLDSDSNLAELPTTFDAKIWYQPNKGVANLEAAKKVYRRGTVVKLSDVRVEHRWNRDRWDLWLNVDACDTALEELESLDKGGNILPCRMVQELRNSPIVASAALKCLAPAVGNWQRPSMFEPRQGGEQAHGQARALARLRENEEASQSVVMETLMAPPAAVQSGTDAAPKSVSQCNKAAGVPLVICPADVGIPRALCDAISGVPLQSKACELQPVSLPSEKDYTDLEFQIGFASPDTETAIRAYNEEGDPSGFLRSKGKTAVVVLKFDLSQAALMLGVKKKPYLVSALHGMWPAWNGFVLVQKSIAEYRTDVAEPIASQWIVRGGYHVDLPTTVVRSGVEVSYEFMSQEFSVPEGDESKCIQGGLTADGDWLAARCNDLVPEYAPPKAKNPNNRPDEYWREKYPDPVKFSECGYANMHSMDDVKLKRLARTSPYESDRSDTSGVCYFLVFPGSHEISKKVRANVGTDASERAAKLALGEKLLREKAAEHGAPTVGKFVGGVHGSPYVISKYVTDNSVALFGCSGF